MVKIIELPELETLWAQLGDIPVNDNDGIDQDFLHFPKGTDKLEIWHWFEARNEKFQIGGKNDRGK